MDAVTRAKRRMAVAGRPGQKKASAAPQGLSLLLLLCRLDVGRLLALRPCHVEGDLLAFFRVLKPCIWIAEVREEVFAAVVGRDEPYPSRH